jgi:hypothetical protein
MPESRPASLHRGAGLRLEAAASVSRSGSGCSDGARLHAASARSARLVPAEAPSRDATAARSVPGSPRKAEASAPVRSEREGALQNPRSGFRSGHRWSGFGYVGLAASRYSRCRLSTNETNAAFIPYAGSSRFVSEMRRARPTILGKTPELRAAFEHSKGARAVVAEGARCTRCDLEAARLECTP